MRSTAADPRLLSVLQPERASFAEDHYNIHIGSVITSEEKAVERLSYQEDVTGMVDGTRMRPVDTLSRGLFFEINAWDKKSKQIRGMHSNVRSQDVEAVHDTLLR